MCVSCHPGGTAANAVCPLITTLETAMSVQTYTEWYMLRYR